MTMKRSHSDRRWSDAPVAHDFPLLMDENIAAGRGRRPRARGCDVRPAEEERLIGRGDSEVLERATALHRVVVTHDLAFGKVEISGGASFVGIVYLRPGHISAAFVQLEISAVENQRLGDGGPEHRELEPPWCWLSRIEA